MLYAWVLSFFPYDSGLVNYLTSVRGRIYIFAAICMGFNAFSHRTMLYAWVFLLQCDLGMLFAWLLRFFRSFIGDINAICMGFKVILRSV